MVLYIGHRPRKDLPMTLPPDITPENLAQVMGPALKALPASPTGGRDSPAVIKGCCLDNALQLDNWPVEMLLKRGYAAAAFYTENLEQDYCNDGENGIICCFHAVKKEDPERWRPLRPGLSVPAGRWIISHRTHGPVRTLLWPAISGAVKRLCGVRPTTNGSNAVMPTIPTVPALRSPAKKRERLLQILLVWRQL